MERQSQNLTPAWLTEGESYKDPLALPLEEVDAKILATLLAALANPIRLGIICLLARGPSSVFNLAIGLDQPQTTISKHLRILRRAEYVTSTNHGKERFYHLNRTNLAEKLIDLASHLDD